MKTKDKKRQQQDKTDKKKMSLRWLHYSAPFSNQQNNSVPWCKNEDHPTFA